jgi:hypothetical protein
MMFVIGSACPKQSNPKSPEGEISPPLGGRGVGLLRLRLAMRNIGTTNFEYLLN